MDGVLKSLMADPCTSDMPYPCNTTSINVVSLSLACSGIALLMAIFLTKKVNKYMKYQSHPLNSLSRSQSTQDMYIDMLHVEDVMSLNLYLKLLTLQTTFAHPPFSNM